MIEKINGRTPEEIKKRLECARAKVDGRCDAYVACVCCPYFSEAQYPEDIIAYIQQLERERDAAVSLLNGECCACLHNEDDEPCRTKEICQCCVHNEYAWGMDFKYNWQWRGVQEVE